MFAQLQRTVCPHLPTKRAAELEPAILRLLERLMVAQAAECYYERALMGGCGRPCTAHALAHTLTSVSKTDPNVGPALVPQVATVLANHYDELCALVSTTLPRGAFASTPLPKDWVRTLKVKRGFHLAAAHLVAPPMMARDPLGEHLVRLNLARAALGAAKSDALALRGPLLPRLTVRHGPCTNVISILG
jgi:hypothetical protein